MYKAVPLALLATSALGQDWFASTSWAPAASAAASATCCTILKTVTFASDDKANTDAAGIGDSTGCAKFGATAFTNLVVVPNVKVGDVGSGYVAGGGNSADATFTVGTDGTTMTWRPTNVGSTSCPEQTLTRVTAALPDLVGTWQPQAGTNANAATTCCFLDTATNVVIGTTGTTTGITAGKYASSNVAGCSSVQGGNYQIGLKAPASGVTTYSAIDWANFNTFSVNAAKDEITVKFGAQADCTQVLKKVPSSAAHYVTPVAVGVAALGLVVV